MIFESVIVTFTLMKRVGAVVSRWADADDVITVNATSASANANDRRLMRGMIVGPRGVGHRPRRLVVLATVVTLGSGALTAGCGGGEPPASWPLPNADLEGTRSVSGGAIDADTVARLRPLWRFRLTGRPGEAGIFASTPVADDDTVYVQDLRSDVFALDRATGRVRWQHRFAAPNGGPNGLALGVGVVYGATDADAFALSAKTGALIWRRHLTSRQEQLVDVAPLPWHDLVFLSTIGYPPFGRGAIYALDARSGRIRWRFNTIANPWPHPLQSGGGGLWYPVSVDDQGRLYGGNSNPAPWGGTPNHPNGAVFPGPVPYTDSLIVLDARTGQLLWYDQVTAHDIRDQDFEATPILARTAGVDVVVGAGKAGRVIAWNRSTRQRLWSASVGLHRNDVGPLPAHRVTVCPGLFGGVETPMAYADERVFVPVVDLCGWGSAVMRQDVAAVVPTDGRGRLVALDAATGRSVWEVRLPSPVFGCATVSNDVVFTATFDGHVYGFSTRDGTRVWSARLPAGINACPAVVGDMLVIGAGVPRDEAAAEVVAFGLARSR
jgi:outer membrane protein assembly factor BamB